MSNRSILDFFAKKQTDSNSGARRASQTGENAQERINLKSKKKGNNGHDPLKERTNKFVKEKVKEGPSKSHVQQCDEGQSHTFNFRYKFNKHAVACDTSKTVLDALNTNQIFKKIKKENMDKEIVIKRSKAEVYRPAVKTDFPCCLIEKDELLDISFIKNTGNVDTKKKTTGRLSFSNESENLVIFYIKTKGGEKVKHLMKNNELRKKVDDVCVYAFKEDKLKAALQRDGRFISVIFKKQCALREFGSEINHVMSSTVEHLDRKHFEIIVISDKNQPDSQDDFLSDVSPEMNEASAADLEENVDPNQHPVNSEQEETKKGNTMKYKNSLTNLFKIIPDSEEILRILRAQFPFLLDILLKRQEKPRKKSEAQRVCRAEYDKSVQSFSEVYKIKQLMRLSDSVCQIRVEGSARGTGFLLFEQFILTNAHVVMELLESPDKLSSTKSLEAAFDFERLDSKVKLVPFKKQITAYCYITDTNKSRLDFALLELDAIDEITDCPELLRYYSPGPPPSRGGICIVGHPEGGIKRTDPCFIIGKNKTQEAADKHISENINFIHVITQRSLEDRWDFYENQINYNSCFFHGSSGSPVFDEHCKLIGVHTGGYVYPGEKGKTRSIVEYAYSIQPILDMIRAQARIRGLHEIVNILEAYSDKSYEYETADQENQTDIEMEDCD
ncbi:serine protease FAM111A isoform X4 [Ctenopharyngodon idella]|uniref:serine protease FAM111A isoform X3 n=1 Tax=Ctenopharyngodon idella TaxID=7959 RepID=UPI0022302A56|nr:serine protease FAM111A isoform X3 [Ctenopharyngodon idella]XP_051751243.1 serine protease FAM111A isoform X4 [Ctenopharyngodon idella]